MRPRTFSLGSFLAVLTLAFFGCFGSLHAETPAPSTVPAVTAPAPPAPIVPAATNPAPVARREDLEPKTLADAKSMLAQSRMDRDTAETKMGEEKARADRLSSQFDSANTQAVTAQRERDEARTERDRAASERDETKTRLSAAHTDISRLEKLCGLQGIDPKAAAPIVPQEQASNTLLATYNAATPEKRGEMMTDPKTRAALRKELHTQPA